MHRHQPTHLPKTTRYRCYAITLLLLLLLLLLPIIIIISICYIKFFRPDDKPIRSTTTVQQSSTSSFFISSMRTFWNPPSTLPFTKYGAQQNPSSPSKPSSTAFYKLSTLAGMSNVSGDGGLGVDAQLNHPRGLFCHYNMLTNNYELYFCDTNNVRIRKINLQTGIIETVISDRDDVLPAVNDGRLSNLAFPTSLALSSDFVQEGNVTLVITNAFMSDGTKVRLEFSNLLI